MTDDRLAAVVLICRDVIDNRRAGGRAQVLASDILDVIDGVITAEVEGGQLHLIATDRARHRHE